MRPLWQCRTVESKLREESCVNQVDFRIVPRQLTWLWPDKTELVDAIAVGPNNAKFWWILPKNHIPL